MTSGGKLKPEEERAYDLIVAEGGMYQSDLWKHLDVSSRKGSRIARSLTDAGVIDREEAVYNGQRTYLLTAAGAQPVADVKSGTSGVPETEDATARDDDGLKPREERALELITTNGGMYQSVFWKEMDVSSRTGSRIASALEARGLIEREETVHNGHVTYLLKPPKRELDFALLMAGDELSPFVESDEVDPHSSAFSQWLLRLEEEYADELW